ncbi:MAG: sporulation protein YtfJ [Tissierellia bacterium]|nr:sporulation protein YtfJ [Tissierellia bacterium]
MSEHPIEGLMKSTMNSLKEMVDVNTIIGDPVQSPDGLVIIPVSKICFGFASGGTEFNKAKVPKDNISSDEKLPFGGGSGAGVSVQPVGFIVVGNNQIKLLTVDEGNTALSSLFDFMTKIADNINEAMDKNSKNQNPNIDIDDNMNIH